MIFWRAGILAVTLAVLSPAALLRIEVEERSDVAEGRAFGRSGAYERIVGRAFFAVDPKLAANRAIVDLDKAPRNAAGQVEFSADFYVLKPRDPAMGNGAALFEVSNRGGRAMTQLFGRGQGEAGDGFLLEQGFTLVWLGWQFDVPTEGARRLRLYTPVVKGLTGLVRAEIVVDKTVTEHSVADRGHVPYPVLNPDDPALTLTVRDRADGPRQTVPRASWRIVDGTKIAMPGGFQPGRLYELVYTSRDPAVAGLGLAGVRDIISFLKYGGGNAAAIMGDSRRYIKRAHAVGVSQSGRFLRMFVYQGFNADEQGRKVFDGVMACVAGGGRGSFNQRFAQPSRDGHPFLNTFYPTDIFPFADMPQTDPETGLTDGILARVAPEHTPKIFYVNSSYEYYGRAASLIHTTVDGRGDAQLAPGTRIYLFAGTQHGPAAFPPTHGGARNLRNFNPFPLAIRALLTAMDAWVHEGKEPPPSQYPRIADQTLTPLSGLRFPKIPGVALPARIQTAWRVDYGPEFRSGGIATKEPPAVGKPFPLLVPQVDEDGNEAAGIRMPAVAVPLGTFTGWNLRTEEIGAPEELFSMAGSYLPFPRTRAEGATTGDPRSPVEERYATKAEYLQKVGAAARRLAQRGYLLDRDVAATVDLAAAEWDRLMGAGR